MEEILLQELQGIRYTGSPAEDVPCIQRALLREAPTISAVAAPPASPIVLIGGGSGTPTVARALQAVGIREFTMIAGSGEVQRDKETLEPVGAGLVRLACQGAPDWIDLVKQSVHGRPQEQWGSWHKLFDRGVGPKMRVGYLVFEALRQILGSIQETVDLANQWMGNPYRVIPATETPTEIKFRVGGQVYDMYAYAFRKEQERLVDELFYDPPVMISGEAWEAVENARYVIVGPGDVHFSVLPPLIVGGMEGVLVANSRAKVVLVCNLTARAIDIPGFTLSRYLDLYGQYLVAWEITALVNAGPLSGTADPLLAIDTDGERYRRFVLVMRDLVGGGLSNNLQPLHDEEKLGRALVDLIHNNNRR